MFKINRTKVALFCVIAITSIFIFVACQKELRTKTHTDLTFNTAAAKEWYYGTFKKSSEWASYSSQNLGLKLPDWKNGIYQKIGSMEIVEFPLVKVKSNLFIPSNPNLTASDNKRIAEASLSRIAFIKTKDNRISVREFSYIPDWDYLSASGFDISKNSITKFDEKFSGRLVIKKWDDTELSRNLMNKGKIIRKGKIKQLPMNNKEKGSESNAALSESCATYEICEYSSQCEWRLIGDALDYVCDPWEPTGNCWQETYCEGGECPSDATTEECSCIMLGLCGDEDGEENCNEKAAELEGNAVSEKVSVDNQGSTATTRTKTYHWIIYKQNWGMWRFISHETGIHKKVTSTVNPWQWQSLTHNNISKEGFNLGGTVSCTLNTANPYVALYNATMELNFSISASAICKGSPLELNGTFTSNGLWYINE